LYARIHELQVESPDLKWIVPFLSPARNQSLCTGTPGGANAALNWTKSRKEADPSTKRLWQESVHTSGTTGRPKGLCSSHQNIISNIKSTIALIPVNCDKGVLSFLPLSHIFERMVIYTDIAVGAAVTYADGQDQIMPSLREVQPHFITAVPLIVERLARTKSSHMQEIDLCCARKSWIGPLSWAKIITMEFGNLLGIGCV